MDPLGCPPVLGRLLRRLEPADPCRRGKSSRDATAPPSRLPCRHGLDVRQRTYRHISLSSHVRPGGVGACNGRGVVVFTAVRFATCTQFCAAPRQPAVSAAHFRTLGREFQPYRPHRASRLGPAHLTTRRASSQRFEASSKDATLIPADLSTVCSHRPPETRLFVNNLPKSMALPPRIR